MKVLFVISGNHGIDPITWAQAKSLEEHGVDVQFYNIEGKGVIGYLINIPKIRKSIINNQPDIIHAHYSFSAFACSLTLAKPLLVSLMGSDVNSNILFRNLINIFRVIFFWEDIIVKTKGMKESLKLPLANVIPNGVDLSFFKPLDKIKCQFELGWNPNYKHILFPSTHDRPEKNYFLAKKSVSLLNNENIELHTLENISFDKVPIYLNASDVILLTSKWEGSPNVIKEAMACCRPIVSTNVGDVEWIFGQTTGCYLTSFDAFDIINKLKEALEFSGKNNHTSGDIRIKELNLDSDSIAKKIIDLYIKINKKKCHKK